MNIKQVVKLDELDIEKGPYTDKNHISSNQELLNQDMDFGEAKSEYGTFEIEHTITKWEGNEIVVFEEGSWMPKTEYKFIEEAKEIAEIRGGKWNLYFGYINGRQHHLGPVATGPMVSASMDLGYTMWIKVRRVN